MANGKKRRKQKKRSKIKMDTVLSSSNNLVKEKNFNCVVNECCSPAILAPAYKNFKHNKITKSKISAFVPPSCVTSVCSSPYLAVKIPKLEFSYYQPPQIETTHIFYGGTIKKVRKQKIIGSNSIIVPPRCIQVPVLTSKQTLNYTYVKPIALEKAAEIVMSAKRYRSKKRRLTSAPIVPLSCVTKCNSVVKVFKKKTYNPLPTERKLSPPIIGPERKLRRYYKKYGNNNVIVPNSCIIQPKPTIPISSYDWRKAFPKPICLEKAADIVGPTIKIRTNRRRYTDSGFVPSSCIIVQRVVPLPEAKPVVKYDEPEGESEVASLAQQPPPETETNNNLYIFAVALIVALIMFAFVISK